MLFPLISVSLIGLVAGLSGLARRAPLAVLGRCLLAAWIGYLAGALLGLVVDVVMIGGFWAGLIGHGGAVLAASQTAKVSAPSRGQLPAGVR